MYVANAHELDSFGLSELTPDQRIIGLSGLGNANQNIAIATTAAQIGTGIALSAHLLAASAAGPIGLGIAAVGLVLSAIFNRVGPKQKVAATHIADDVGRALQQNMDEYRNGPHTVADYQAAIANFEYATGKLREGCSDPNLGDAGVRCISERLVEGGTAPWCPTPDHRGCDWYKLYLDPILQDPPHETATNIFSDGAGVLSGSFLSGAASGQSAPSFLPLALAGLLIVAAVSL